MTIAGRIVAAVLFAAITFATLSPIQMRPHVTEANVERAAAYLLLGAALALGFPRWVYHSAAFMLAAAAALEVLQLIDPGRHGRIPDMLVKVAAGLIGLAVTRALILAVSDRAAE